MANNEQVVAMKLDSTTADEQVALFNKVFNENVTVEKWIHKHFKNPEITDISMYGGRIEGKLVGIIGAMPEVHFVNGKAVPSIQICDVAVDPDYRRKGIYSTIYSLLLEDSKKSGYAFFNAIFLGFPLGKTYEAFLKAGWTEVSGNRSWAYIKNPAKIIASKANNNAITSFSDKLLPLMSLFDKCKKNAEKCSGFDIQVSQSYPFPENEEKIICNLRPISYKYSPELSKWKIENTNGCKRTYYVARKNGKLYNYFVISQNLNQSGYKKLVLMDWGFPEINSDYTGTKQAFASMLRQACENADAISAWVTHSDIEKKLFSEIGFTDFMLTKQESPVLVLPFSKDEELNKYLVEKNNWDTRYLELDISI